MARAGLPCDPLSDFGRQSDDRRHAAGLGYGVTIWRIARPSASSSSRPLISASGCTEVSSFSTGSRPAATARYSAGCRARGSTSPYSCRSASCRRRPATPRGSQQLGRIGQADGDDPPAAPRRRDRPWRSTAALPTVSITTSGCRRGARRRSPAAASAVDRGSRAQFLGDRALVGERIDRDDRLRRRSPARRAAPTGRRRRARRRRRSRPARSAAVFITAPTPVSTAQPNSAAISSRDVAVDLHRRARDRPPHASRRPRRRDGGGRRSPSLAQPRTRRCSSRPSPFAAAPTAHI